MIDLRSINKNRFALAKRLWMLSNAIKLSMFLVGSISVFTQKTYPYVPQALLVMAGIAELVQWRSDIIKSSSESLLRNLDLCSSFQREISAADKRDIVFSLPRKLRARFDNEVPDTYFTSSEPLGPRKAVENLVESAWYTKKQAETMAIVCIGLIALLLIVSIAALFVSSGELANASAREGVSRVITSWLLLIFSLGLTRNAWLYYKMSQRCQKTEANGDHLLKSEVTEADALKQWYEYQIGRSSSPLLPEWLWKLKRSSLEYAWRTSKGLE